MCGLDIRKALCQFSMHRRIRNCLFCCLSRKQFCHQTDIPDTPTMICMCDAHALNMVQILPNYGIITLSNKYISHLWYKGK